MPKYEILIKTTDLSRVVVEAIDMLNALDMYNHGDHDEPQTVPCSYLLFEPSVHQIKQLEE